MTSRSLIVGFRVLLLAAAGAAVAAAVLVVARSPSESAAARYVCPMHPEVRSAAPAQCPICGMALEPVTRGPNAPSRPGDMPGMGDFTAVENVRKHKILDFVRRRSLLPNIRELRGAAAVGDDGAITAILYKDQIDSLASDERGTFSLAAEPDETFAVRRTADPIVARDASTAAIRFRADGAAARPWRPRETGWVTLEPKAREVLGVPAAAVLQSPEGPYVLAWMGGNRFDKRRIEIGETFLKQGFAVVLSGLRAQDRVVSRATFFVDADRRLHGDGALAEDGNP